MITPDNPQQRHWLSFPRRKPTALEVLTANAARAAIPGIRRRNEQITAAMKSAVQSAVPPDKLEPRAMFDYGAVGDVGREEGQAQ